VGESSAGDYAVNVQPLREYLTPNGAYALGLLAGSLVLLVVAGWIQIAGLVLGPAVTRTPEIGIRIALGASLKDFVVQFAAEQALVLVPSLVLAVLTAPWLVAGIVRILPAGITAGRQISSDISAVLVCGLAWRAHVWRQQLSLSALFSEIIPPGFFKARCPDDLCSSREPGL
jgi:hypothetical protein